MKKLHPGAKWLFRLGVYFVLFFLSIFFLVFGISALALFGVLGTWGVVTVILVDLFLILVFGEVYAQLAYSNWAYDFAADGLKLERGIIWKRYSNIPYERVQNVEVHRGILARMLGFSSVMVQTAGFSGPARAEGNIPAVSKSEAEEIRTFLMHKITGRRK